MSLFKAREWWSTTVGDNEVFDVGCLCSADFNSTGSDKVVVGSYHGRLSVYQPTPSDSELSGHGFKADDVVCELQLAEPILQVDAGRFVSGSDCVHLAVLHPRKLVVYSLAAVAGVTDHGTQYQLRSIYEHKLQRTAFNFCSGPFGGVKGRDFICVQSMDGTVSVFEQETFSFSRFLPSALLPGPVRYVVRTDSIVTVSSCRQIESYKFQILATASDGKGSESQNVNQGKRVTADWTFLINESAVDIVVANFESSALTVYVLGERNLYALSEGGLLLFMKKFDYNPCCFLPYCSGRNDSIHCIVGTHSNTLLIYQNITLKWTAQLSFTPVQIRVANFKELKGVVVALDEEGHLSCLYLGTDPAMLSHPSAYLRELDYTSVETEMKQLQRIIKEQQTKSSLPTPSLNTEDELKLSVDVPSVLDRPSQAHDINLEDDVPAPSVTITVLLQSKSAVQNVKLMCSVLRPLVASEPVTIIPAVVPGQPVETKVTFFMRYNLLPSDLKVTVVASYCNNAGACRLLQSRTQLPVSLIIRPCLPVKNATYKLTIDTNKSPISLSDLFSDLCGASSDASANVVGFKFYGLETVITLLASKSSQRYRVQSDNFGFMWHMLKELIVRLRGHFKMGSSSDFRLYYSCPLPLQEFFEVIDRHFECRNKEAVLTKQLDEHAAQFRATQKRLLIMFKDKTPAPLKNLDSLLDMTYKQVMLLANTLEENSNLQKLLSAELSCSTRIINLLTQLWLDLSSADIAVLDSVLSPVVNDTTMQGWEEMTDASVTHLLRTNLSKNAKDLTLNPSPLGHLKDIDKLKKHITLMFDRLGKGAKLTEGSTAGSQAQSRKSVDSRSTSKTDIVPASADTDRTSYSVTEEKNSNSLFGLDFDAPRVNGAVRSEKRSQLASGEPSRRVQDNWEATRVTAREVDETIGSQQFRKKSAKASDNVPDLDDTGRLDEETDALHSANDELIYGL